MTLKSFSNEGQDILALKLLGHSGFFLDIGCGNPVYGNNSFVLELMGWKGLLVDGDTESVTRADRYRINPVIQCDVTQADWATILSDFQTPKIIDFISMDTDSANTVLVRRFPWDRYQFRLMCFEHDSYNSGEERKRACKEALAPYPQYIPLLDDAMTQGLQWEDWYVNRNLIDPKWLIKCAAKMDWQAFLSTL